MSAKKIIVALVIILVAIAGFVAGLILLRERQELREEAAVPGGQAKVSIEPTSGNYKVGDSIQASVSFNTANIAISGVAVRLIYPFGGATPEVTVSSIDINPTILSSGDWTCPTKSSSEQGSNVIIDIACANTSSAGFTSAADTLLANITLNVERQPSTETLAVRFDNQLSIITQKTTGEDILLIPASSGSYTIGTTTVGSPTPTKKLTGTITATPKVTKAPTGVASPSATPTKGGQLPDAGVSYPTIIGVGLGVLILVGGILLAL